MSETLLLPPVRPGRRITLSLTPPAAFGGIIGLCAGFVLVFCLGVLLGRGYHLEKNIPELERILPDRAAVSPPQIIAGDVASADPRPSAERSVGAQSAGAVANPGQHAPGVINPGDLDYRDNLKQTAPPSRSGAKTGAQAPATSLATAKAAGVQTANTRKSAVQNTGQSAARNEGRNAPGQASDLRPPLPGPERTAPVETGGRAGKASGGNQVYHYVYQAAAYKDEPSCAAFTDKLKRAGFKARIQKSEEGGTTWYRTVVDFSGTPDATDALRENLKQHGVPRVIMKSKTPAR